MKRNKLITKLGVALAMLVAPAASVDGQTAPANGAAEKEDKAIVMSPFEVRTDTDVGYVGQNTLAGSRLNTSLKDVAAAISPMTAEFLQDIAATNVIEAMEYGMNTRMETDDGRAAGPVGDTYNQIPEIRIRGLPGGSRTTNYFRTLGEVDTYKVERLDVSRGPNSILYGFGSPAGVVNSSTKQAKLSKTDYSTSFRVDSWNGYRAVVDANVPVIKDNLALRATMLKGEESSWRRGGHLDQESVYLTGTWRIDRKTTLKADFEKANINRYVPRPFFGIDLLSAWDAAGQPKFTNFDLSRPAGTAGTPGNPIRATGGTAATGVQQISTGNWAVVSDAFPFAQNYLGFTTSQRLSPIQNDFVMGRANPEAVFEANWVGAQYGLKNYNSTLQRELFSGMNVELAYSQQVRTSNAWNLATWDTYGLMADPNRYYPNGELKSADNQYYFELRRVRVPNEQKLRQLRAVLSYERDFGDLVQMRAAGLFEQSKSQERRQQFEEYWLNGPELTSGGAFAPDPSNTGNRVYHRYYVDRSVIHDPNYRIPTPYDASGGILYQDPLTGTTRTIYAHWANLSAGNIRFRDERMESKMVVSQLYLFKNRVVMTGGYRGDQVKYFDSPAIRDPAAPAGVGVWIPVLPTGDPTAVLKGETFTMGGVVHLRSWLSGFYNTSKSVNVPGNNRVFGPDPTVADFDPQPPLRVGRTHDYGFKLDLFGNRLFATGTRFRTKALDDTYFSSFTSLRNPITSIWNALRDSGGVLTAEEQAIAATSATAAGRPQGLLINSKTEGYEFELVGEPFRGWSISLNYSNTESKRSNIGREVRAYIDQWRPLWLKYADFATPQNFNQPRPQRNSPNDFRSPAEIRSTGDFTVNTDTVKETLVDLEDAFFDIFHVYEGMRYVGDNKHNFNLRSRYAFREGVLKGLTVGVGMRLRAGRIAGSLADWEFREGSDYTDPYNGRVLNNVKLIKTADQAILDLQLSYRRSLPLFNNKVSWSIQLNVNNVTDEDDLIVNQTHPTTGAPLTYRYQDPRRFILTNTFSF